MKAHRLLSLAVMFWLTMTACAAETNPEIVEAEKTLQESKLATTGPALLQFFREHTTTTDDKVKLADAVRRLGDDEFEVREKAERELIRAGRKALLFLRPALRDGDAERVLRATRCVAEIENGAEQARVIAAARLLADRKPEGAVTALLTYLPNAESEMVEEALFRALLTLGLKDGKADPALLQALTDKEPLQRVAAAFVLGRLDPTQRAIVRRLLTDENARVRFEAAVALTRGGDKEGIPALMELLAKGPMTLAWQSQEILFRVAGDKAPSVTLTTDEATKRNQVADAWNLWWKDAGAKLDPAKINLDEVMQGVNLICQENGGGSPARVFACRADGKPLWEIKDVQAWEAQLLPNGNVLIGEYNNNRITERDTTGKILMTIQVNSTPTTCRRLPNGNTFIATFNNISEVDPKGAVLWTFNANEGLIGRSHRLRNGNILYAAAGHKVVEMDPAHKQLRKAEVPSSGDSWMSLEPLPADRFLIAPYGAHKVMEIDATGKVLWECNTKSPMSAVRLPNGNTLVGSHQECAAIEYDRAGKEVWRLKLEGGVRCVRRY